MQNRKFGQTDIPTADGKKWTEPKIPWAAIYPYNHVHQTESGHVIEMDDTPNEERLHWYHRTGTFTEIHPVGIKVDKIVNNYYNIILGAKYTHIEASDYTTIDGSQENYILGNRVDRIDGDYSIAVKKGRFNVDNPLGAINLEASNMTIRADETLTLSANNVIIEKKSAKSSEITTGDEKKTVGGKLTHQTGAFSLNSQGSIGMQSGGGMTFNITDSINESIFGVLPSMTSGYAKKTSATLGKIGMECTDNLLSGGIELNLGLLGAGAWIAMKPLGDIEIKSNLGMTGITAETLMPGANIKLSSGLGDVSMDTLMSSFLIETGGDMIWENMTAQISVSKTGKIKVSGLVSTLKEILDELIDSILEHTHPTGVGPSGPPMVPVSTKLPLLKSLKIKQSME